MMDTTSPLSAAATRAPALPAFPEDLLGTGALRTRLNFVRRKVERGACLYHSGQPFHSLYLVHVGTLKIRVTTEGGREQVMGFRLRGDLLGAESIGLDAYYCDAVALDDAEVWCMPYVSMLRAAGNDVGMNMHLTAMLADSIRRDQAWMLRADTLGAAQRVAAFLLDFAARHAKLGYSASHFILKMRRVDIASYLGIQHETVTRVLTRLAQRRLIAVQRREIRLLDIPGLNACMSESPTIH